MGSVPLEEVYDLAAAGDGNGESDAAGFEGFVGTAVSHPFRLLATSESAISAFFFGGLQGAREPAEGTLLQGLRSNIRTEFWVQWSV